MLNKIAQQMFYTQLNDVYRHLTISLHLLLLLSIQLNESSNIVSLKELEKSKSAQ